MKKEVMDRISAALADRNMSAVSRRTGVFYRAIRDIAVGNYGRVSDDEARTLARYLGIVVPSEEMEGVGEEAKPYRRRR